MPEEQGKGLTKGIIKMTKKTKPGRDEEASGQSSEDLKINAVNKKKYVTITELNEKPLLVRTKREREELMVAKNITSSLRG